jgi:predicted DCC family thiol-disulfide oxidoreductase YuxK
MLLGGRWRVLGMILRAVPLSVRNAAYRTFARNRYRLSGQHQVCPVPSEAEQIKFVG